MLIKLLFLITIVSSINITFNTLYNDPIYIIKGNESFKLDFQIIKNNIIQSNNIPKYGYLNNLNLTNYMCLTSYGFLLNSYTENVNNSNNKFSTCNNVIDTYSPYRNSSLCEKYNDTILLEYILSFNTNNDIKCFFDYTIKNYSFVYFSSLIENNINFNINVSYSDLNLQNIQIEGNTIYNNNYNINTGYTYSFSCQTNNDTNYFFYNLLTFDKWSDLIDTSYVNCMKNIDSWTSLYLDYNNLNYNNLNYVNADIENNVLKYNVDAIVNISIYDNVIIKNKDTGCYIDEVYYNNFTFLFYLNCFEDYIWYVDFNFGFTDLNNNKFEINYQRITDDNWYYSFNLITATLPTYMYFVIENQIIYINISKMNSSIYYTDVLYGNMTYPDNNMTIIYFFIIYASILSVCAIILSIYGLTLNGCIKWIFCKKLLMKEDYLKAKSFDDIQKIINIPNLSPFEQMNLMKSLLGKDKNEENSNYYQNKENITKYDGEYKNNELDFEENIYYDKKINKMIYDKKDKNKIEKLEEIDLDDRSIFFQEKQIDSESN
jgi:hypothetical protein